MDSMIVIGVIFFIIIGMISFFSNGSDNNNNTNNVTNKENETTAKKEYDYNRAYYSVYSLLSKAEMSFYKILFNICNELDVSLFTKVRVADIIKVGKIENRQAYFNKIKSKHIDFVLFHKDSLKPLVCIELDDKSHNNQSRKERDEFMDKIIEIAGYKSLHIKCSYIYNRQSIKEAIEKALAK